MTSSAGTPATTTPEVPTDPALRDDLVTVVIPARDEERSIEGCLASILAQDEPSLQVIVVDGCSTDGTRELVRAVAARDPRVELLDNPERIVPTGMNRALAAARGAWLVRVDAHATVPPDYVSRAVGHLRTGRWGAVGGRKDAVGHTPAGRAIAAAMASPFGVGGSAYHHATVVQETDHVPFGAYPTALARDLGGWDPELVTNQDFEYDHRVRLAGHRILHDPALRIDWECRQSIRDLWRQYRRYGRGKVDVLRKHPRSASPRHLVPPVLVAGLGASAVAAAATRRARFLAPVAAYAAGVGVATAATSAQVGRDARPYLPLAFAAMHLSWGLGFWQSLARHVSDRARRRRV